MGIGFAPLWSNCFDFLDKNLSHSDFPLYTGVLNMSNLVGTGVGFLLGGYFLSFPFDDVHRSSRVYRNMSSSEYKEFQESPNYIGAYWIGFVICAIAIMLISIPVSAFPYEFPGSKEIRSNRRESKSMNHESSEISTDLSWRDFKEGFLSIVGNPLILSIIFGTAMEMFYMALLSSFAPKYLEIVFNLTSSEASLVVGAALIPSAFLALILGGVVPKCFKMETLQLLSLTVISSFITLGTTFALFISCEQADFIEPSSSITYQNNTCQVNNCECSEINYKPFCLDLKTVIFSPCYYGCKNTSLVSCSCNRPEINFDLREGLCETSEFCSSSNFYLLTALVAASCFSVFFKVPSAEAAMNRSSNSNFTSLMFGFEFSVLRIFGSIPAPLIAGAMFDNGCTYWQKNQDGGRESCLRYDKSVTKGFTAMCVTSSGLMAIFFLAALMLHRWQNEKKMSQQTEAEVTSP